jgi:uncharacterized protein (DUF488 family)
MSGRKNIWTIGHSTRSLDEFLSLLITWQIQSIADIRRFPGSNRFPQYNKEVLANSLQKEGIQYFHLEALGGRRNPSPHSVNTAWRVRGFRGYADYMETYDFKKAVIELEHMAASSRCAYMCTEAVWWSCHRALLSDYLKAKGWQVMHIMSKEKVQEHPYTKAATVVNGEVRYTDSNTLF